ncbi:MAG: tetratricopeptide repeat protein [Bacteroidales bacterium]
MKLRTLALMGGFLAAASLSAQTTLTDVINEFNTGVENINSQEYELALEHFNQVISLADEVGAEADEMKANAQSQIPATYYRQATVFMKRKQYDNAIPYLEKTVESAAQFGNNEEIAGKAQGYLPPLYVREGNAAWKNQNQDAALEYFDKALSMNEALYQAHQGKGLVFFDKGEIDMMLQEFDLAKKGALAENDDKTISAINDVINSHYNGRIQSEFDQVDEEEADYTYVIEACEKALEANAENPRAYYYMAMINNKNIEFDAAIQNAEKALQFESDPVWTSAINYELGLAYSNTAEYEKACETLQKVMEEPFLSRAEKKLETVPGCN